MNLNTVRRTFLIGAPLAFAALLTLHPTGTGTMFDAVSESATTWLMVHYGGAIGFPAMALVIWLLIRGVPGRAATIARCALPVYAVFYGVWEAIFGIATGIIADAGNSLSGAEREGAEAAFDAIVSSPLVGEPGVFVSIGSLAWWTAISAAIMALKHAGVRPFALVLLGLGGLLAFHVPIGPPALVCLSIAAFMIERDRARVAA